MEQKPFKIKYGTVGIVYVWAYLLTRQYYPSLWEHMKSITDPNFGTIFFFTMMLIAPLIVFLRCND